MSIYIDANVLVALFLEDELSERASSAVNAISEPMMVSDLAALEFASALARRSRARAISPRMAAEALSDFDAWVESAERLETGPADIERANTIVRRFDINLHGADAIHAALALRAGAALLTMDTKMRANARKVGVAIA